MTKTAYIIGIEGVDEKNCSRTHETDVSVIQMAAVGSLESGERLVMKLVEEGFSVINLGMGFDEEVAEELREKTEGKARIRCIQYTINECVRRIRLVRNRSHGIIIAAAGIDKPCEFFIPDKAHDTRIILVKNMMQARNAARKLTRHNVGFIELSTWFDIFRMEDVIDAIDGAVPVGTCGIIDVMELEMFDAEPELDPEKLKPKKRVYKRRQL